MYLTHLSLTNFRSFARLDSDVSPGINLIVGDNAQGKTTLLESIYYLSTLTSFQASQQRELINFLAVREPLAVARIEAEYRRGERAHHLEVRIIQESNGNGGVRLRREVLLDRLKRKGSEVIGHFNAVLFLPRMFSIIAGAPAERRQYLNLTIAQIDPRYTAALTAYNKALSQRNALLKQINERGGDPNQLDYWDELIAQNGAIIIAARIQALQELEDLAAIAHSELTRGAERLRLIYRPAYDPYTGPANQLNLPIDAPVDRSGYSEDDIAEGLQEALRTARREEIARGMTTLGPHRDDLHFLSNGVNLGAYGSRGQVRTTLLALKIAEISWLKKHTNFWPVVLLDEVLAELDNQRRADLLQRLSAIRQALLTTTDLSLFSPEFIASGTIWKITGGRLER